MSGSIRIDTNVPMEMRDGVLLRADIYRPDDGAKHPVIFLRTPYNKRTPVAGISDFFNITLATFEGYAVVFQDVRGRYASDGVWNRGDMLTVEPRDGYDSVEWIASQPWCDGNVGMAGLSYLAGLQWMTAISNPPHLKAIAPWQGGMRSVGTGMLPALTGGVISVAVPSQAIPSNAVDVIDRLERGGQDVAEMRRVVQWAVDHPDEVYNYLPLKDVPFARFDVLGQMWRRSLHPIDFTLSEAELENKRPYHQVMVPCFHIAGWYDTLEQGSFESFIRMRAGGGSPAARNGQYIVAGPWTHARAGVRLGGLSFGPTAGDALAGLHTLNLAFFDKYLRGLDVQMPAVRYFAMGRNRWQTADAWPLPQTQWQRWHLHSQGDANTAAGDGVLDRDAPGSERPDRFIYDPHSPVPSVGGRFIGAGLTPGPVEQSHVEKRRDVLCYTSPELKEDAEVTGPLEVRLFAATSARDTDFVAKLVDVYPDGRAYNVAEGIKRARGRKSPSRPEFVTPGEVNEYVITLGNTSQVFRKGHCIRLDVSSSDFPQFDRNMNTGNGTGEDAEGIPAMQTIYHDDAHPSHIVLPIIPSAA